MTEISYNPDEIIAQFDKKNLLPVYFNLLLKENEKINLVSRETATGGFINSDGSPQNLIELAAESLLPLTIIEIENDVRYLDIGSGGGFPSIPIILTQNLVSATLIERTQKKAGALRRMLLTLKKSVNILPASFEDFKGEQNSFDLITLRLVKLTKPILSQALSLLNTKGTFIYYSDSDLEFDDKNYKIDEYTFSTTNNPPKRYTIIRREYKTL
ncbi:MAG: RsmG family class I SAM-dependent methyltransferase [bacterium]